MDELKRPPERMTRKGFVYVRLPFEGDGYNELLADQRIQGGDVCIRGTRIPAHTIYAQYASGTLS